MISMPKDQVISLIKFASTHWDNIVSAYLRVLYNAVSNQDLDKLDELLDNPLVKSLRVDQGGYNPLGTAIGFYLNNGSQAMLVRLLRKFAVSDGYNLYTRINEKNDDDLIAEVIDLFKENRVDMDNDKSSVICAVIRRQSYGLLGKVLYGGVGLRVTPSAVKSACSLWRAAHNSRGAQKKKEFALSALFKLIELGADVDPSDVSTIRMILGSSFKINAKTRVMLQSSIVKAELSSEGEGLI